MLRWKCRYNLVYAWVVLVVTIAGSKLSRAELGAEQLSCLMCRNGGVSCVSSQALLKLSGGWTDALSLTTRENLTLAHHSPM